MSNVVAVVGMGPGVSLAVARRFAREGYAVAAVARRADALKEQVDLLAAGGAQARAFTADSGDAASLVAALTQIGSQMGEPDVLIYNAAGVRFKPLAELSADEFIADLRVSIGGALAASQAVLPAMRKKGRGTLLFTGGGFAFEPMPALASLGVGKAGIRNLAFSLFADLKDSGIHAGTVTICGPVKEGTPFDPARIAEAYWTLHAQAPGAFEREIMFKG
jgi:NADP-dependent 3-hydroxy acid dehydrogenase YdfG